MDWSEGGYRALGMAPDGRPQPDGLSYYYPKDQEDGELYTQVDSLAINRDYARHPTEAPGKFQHCDSLFQKLVDDTGKTHATLATKGGGTFKGVGKGK